MGKVGRAALLLDDDDGLREGLTWMFESADIPVHSYSEFEVFRKELHVHLHTYPALCLVLALRMPTISGLEVFDWLKREEVNLDRLPVIFLTGHGDISTAVEAVKNGAFDFYEKPATDQRLVERVQQALEHSFESLGKQQIDQELKRRLNKLSRREREVMDLVAKGTLNKVIAADFKISMRTVEVHRSKVFEKFEVRSAAELATLLSQMGWELPADHLSGLE